MRTAISKSSESRNRKHYSRLKAAGLLSGTVKNAVAKRKARDENPPYEPGRITIEKHRLYVFTYGVKNGSKIIDQYRELQNHHSRKKNWRGVTLTTDIADREMRVNAIAFRNSHRYSRGWYNYEAVVRSFCCVSSDGKYLLWFIGRQHGRVTAPRGWMFGVDSNLGVYIAKRSDKDSRYWYHLSANDVSDTCLRRQDFMNLVRSFRRTQEEKIRQSKEKQKRAALYPKLVKKAREIGVFVLYRDSRIAGNCAAGTMRWCDDKGLDIRKFAPLELIEKFVDDFYVKRVVDAAIDRAITDMERGYCETVYWDPDMHATAQRMCLATEPEEALC